jgi:DNA ligase (NAD+)
MIEAFLDKASKAYYEGAPIISDEEFDRLAALAGYNKVGAAVKGIPHLFRMYSLQKVHFGESEIQLCDPVKTPKLDGAAISILYIPVDSTPVLSGILTRGDGLKGLDITSKLRHLVPEKLEGINIPVQVNAEVVAPKTIPNSRNYASGALNLKDEDEVKSRNLTVIAYDLQPFHAETYEGTLSLLAKLGFRVPTSDCSDFPTDGYVVRENSNALFEKAGFTSKHPKAAYALKPKPESAITTLLDVVWQVGRTGVVSPVAILEPVLIGEATISRATLHNMQYIEALNLELGCKVEVIRSGEIIPRIVARV